MELGLSLGDASNTVEFSKETKSTDQDQKPTKMSGLDFCMALGLSRSSEDDCDREHLQLNLLPDNPVRQIKPHLQSLPWSSDNGGSSENGSSAAARVLDVNRLPAEEVSSTNSVGSPLIHIDIGMYRDSTRGIDGDYSCNNRSLSTDFEAANGNNDDDDEENGINVRKKLRLSKQQSAFLEESFKEQSTLNPKQKLALAKQLNLRPRQVEVWFQNRRARTKLKKTEVDCEYLKRCCETLTEENRRLQKELQELRALKKTNPFYMQLPATTLTMCPSCEKVATMTDTIPFPLTRPRFYPFTRAPTHSNN